MLCDVIEKHSNNKKVTLMVHNWGSYYGMNLAMDKPELVTRIATLDIRGHSDPSMGYRLFEFTY